MVRSQWVLGMVVVFLAATGAVYAQDEMGVKAMAAEGAKRIVAGGAVGQITSLTAEVSAIDYEKREATIKLPDGTERLIAVTKEAYNFDQVKVGDKVNIDLEESIALYVDRMPSEPGVSSASVLSRAPKGQKPEGVAVSYVDGTATVTDIDYEKRNISLLNSEGKTMTINVPVDAAPNFDKIQKGDTVVVRYTSALALKVEPADAKKE